MRKERRAPMRARSQRSGKAPQRGLAAQSASPPASATLLLVQLSSCPRRNQRPPRANSTGTISLKNLRRVAKELGENMTDDELQERHAMPPWEQRGATHRRFWSAHGLTNASFLECTRSHKWACRREGGRFSHLCSRWQAPLSSPARLRVGCRLSSTSATWISAARCPWRTSATFSSRRKRSSRRRRTRRRQSITGGENDGPQSCDAVSLDPTIYLHPFRSQFTKAWT